MEMLFIVIHVIVLLMRPSQGTPIAPAQQNEELVKESYRQAKAAEMLGYMNQEVDPCADFYEFTCGNYANYKTTHKDGTETMPTIMNIAEVTDAQLKLELEHEDALDSSVDRKVKSFYKSCLKVTPAIAGDTAKVFEYLKVLHKMPLLMGAKWQESDFEWESAVAEIIQLIGESPIIDIGAVTDYNDNTITRVGLSEPKHVNDMVQLLKTEEYANLRESYLLTAAYDMQSILGADKNAALECAKELLDFEIALVQGKCHKHLGLQNSEIYNLTSIEELQSTYMPDMDAQKLLGKALDFIPQQVYVNHRYVANALRVLKATPPRIVANYIYFTSFKQFLCQFLVESDDLPLECVAATQDHFYKQLDNMLYRKVITDDMKHGLYDMWQELKVTFRAMLQSSKLRWMQEETRQYALEKLEAMKLSILAHEGNHFEEEYASLKLNDHDFLANLIAIFKFKANRTRSQIHEPPLPEDEGVVASYSPSYSPIDNLIKIPVILLQQYAKFSPSYPQALNFGSMGAYIGHEMLHGFDDAGRKYDAKGNSRDWWDLQAAGEFRNRTKCFIDQYKNYSVAGSHLPEMQMQAENIADNGGIRTAYQAYLQWYAKALKDNSVNLQQESLPGLNYTNRQLFFISYGQVWCTTFNAISTKISLATDTHVPPNLRVIGSLSNYEEFAKEFKCPMGSPMNPVKKCEIY